MDDLGIKIFIDDDQLDTLRKSGRSTFDEFVKGFEQVEQTAETTFFRFNRVGEDNLRKTKSTFDKLYGGDNAFSKIQKGFAGIFEVDNLFDIFDGTKQLTEETLQSIYDSIFNESVVTDVPIKVNPIVEEPIDISRLVNPQPSEPINFQELIKEADRKKIQDRIDKLESEGKTIEELAVALRDSLQKDLDNFGQFEGFDIPELKINITDLKLKVDNLDRKELEEGANSLFLQTGLSSFSVQDATDQQLRAFLTLKTVINDLDTQHQTLKTSLEAQALAMTNSTAKAEQAEKTLGDLGNTEEAVNSVTGDLAGNAEDLADNFKDTKKQVSQVEKTVGKFDGTAVDLGTSLEKTDEVAQQLGENGLPKIKDGAETAGEGVVKAAEEGKKGLSSLGVFAGNIATNIAESFSGFISTAIKGDFDGIGDLWDDLLDTETEENQQNVINLDEFREKRVEISQFDENEQKFQLAA